MAGRRARLQGPGELHHTTCKRSFCSFLQSLCCPAAPALQVEPAGLHFSAVQTGKGKLIKPLPEGRMHQEGQVKPQAQQTQRQQPSLRPRLNNYQQSFPWTRQSWLFFSNRPTTLGKPTIPKTFSINCPKELLANYWRHKSCRRLALSLKACHLNLSHYMQVKLYLAEWESYKPPSSSTESENKQNS